MGVSDTIKDHIDMAAFDSGHRIVSSPIRGTHPYERIGQQVIEQLYQDPRVKYRVLYGSAPGNDRVSFSFKRPRRILK